MCAIGGYYCFGEYRPKVSDIKVMFRRMEEHNTDATGYALVTEKNNFVIVRQAERVCKFLETTAIKDKFEEFEKDGLPRAMLLHTRLASQGDPSKIENNHPIPGKHCVVIHNGCIMNPEEYDREASAEVVDSRALACMIDETPNNLDEIPGLISKLRGSAAFAAFVKGEDGSVKLILARDEVKFYWSYISDLDMLVWCTMKKGILYSSFGQNAIIDRGFVQPVPPLVFPKHSMIVVGDETETEGGGIEEVYGISFDNTDASFYVDITQETITIGEEENDEEESDSNSEEADSKEE